MNAVKHWGVIVYLLAAVVSIFMGFAFAATPGLAAKSFPEASSEDLVRAAECSVAALAKAEASR